MKILIDTHIFLWLANDSLEKMNRDSLDKVYDTDNNVYISSLSITEIMILDFDVQSALLPASLPFYYRDSFDRMIISQAITGRLTIFTVNRKFKLYACELLYPVH